MQESNFCKRKQSVPSLQPSSVTNEQVTSRKCVSTRGYSLQSLWLVGISFISFEKRVPVCDENDEESEYSENDCEMREVLKGRVCSQTTRSRRSAGRPRNIRKFPGSGQQRLQRGARHMLATLRGFTVYSLERTKYENVNPNGI